MYTLLFAIYLLLIFPTLATSQSQLKRLDTFGTAANGVGYSTAVGINARGQVCGESDYYVNGVNKGPRAFLYDPATGIMRNLGTLGTDADGVGSSHAAAINDRGQVCGYSGYYVNGVGQGSRAFLYDPATGVMQNLGSLGTDRDGGGLSRATAINDKGQVCGYSWYYVEGIQKGSRAFLYDPAAGVIQNLGVLTFGSSTATAINNKGQVCGTADFSEGNFTLSLTNVKDKVKFPI